MMKKDDYIKEKIEQQIQFWVGWALFFGALFFVLIGILDYIATPENFTDFVKYRLLGTLIFVSFFILNRKKISKRYQTQLTYFAILSSGIIIEYMVLHFGGHSSTYYAGFFLLVMLSVGFIPIDLKDAIYIAVVSFAIYAIPVLYFDHQLDYRYFSMPLFFLASTLSIATTWRHISNKRIISELSLQYDLDQKKRELEDYSRRLEEMVQERTRDLRKSELRHRALFENATDGIVLLDKKGEIINLNNRAAEMHQYTREELIGKSIWKLEANSAKPEISIERMNRLLNGQALVFESTQMKKDGSYLPLEISSKAITIEDELFVQSFYRDITEKKKMEAHLFQSQKMESIGILAGGIAHDFNNILTAILGHTEIVKLFPKLDARSTKSLQIIENAARKAGTLISKLLGFARKSGADVLSLNLNDVITDGMSLLERSIDKNIALRLELAEKLPFIKGDVTQIEHLLMNLIVNARDAMPQGGEVVISTAHKNLVNDMQGFPAYVEPGEYVQLSLTDNGAGIPEHIIHKIFEPFFTTKAPGKGTGLGLAMCYGAVVDHKGYILVESKVGVGTTFKILFPASSAPNTTITPQPVTPPKGTETILAVDDEGDILLAIRETLKSSGYKVFIEEDPINALKVFKDKSQEVSLVITDMVMPKMDGKELMKQLRTINPKVKLLAISGYLGYVAEKSSFSDTAWFIQKPFSGSEFLVTVRKILDSASHNPSRINN